MSESKYQKGDLLKLVIGLLSFLILTAFVRTVLEDLPSQINKFADNANFKSSVNLVAYNFPAAIVIWLCLISIRYNLLNWASSEEEVEILKKRKRRAFKTALVWSSIFIVSLITLGYLTDFLKNSIPSTWHFIPSDSLIFVLLLIGAVLSFILFKKIRSGWRPSNTRQIRMACAIIMTWVLAVLGIDFIFDVFESEILLRLLIVPPVLAVLLFLIFRWVKRS